jgi:carbamoyl-phosphate synthase/aspartate carbamoyltransferase/dihydroorotase
MRVTIPGMVDPHVHLRGMTWSHKGTFASETAAALAGGYWAVLDMPNTPPATIDTPALNEKLGEIGAQAVCDWGVYFGAATTENWRVYDDVDLIDRVCGLKIYNNQTTGTLLIDDQDVRAAHYRAWPPEKIIAVHAEGDTVLDILALVRQYGKRTHFCHISSADEIRALTAAKDEGLPITIGVCPHHLYLTQNDVASLGALGLMKPELKTQADVDALWAAVQNGVVDVVESDHAPHTLAEKFSAQAVYGVPGLETTLPLLCLAVREGRLSMERVIDLVANNPRRIFGLPCPDETHTVVDMDESFLISRTDLHTACGWSPFEGMRVYGKVRSVTIRGTTAFDGENVLVEHGFGRNLYG